MVIRSAIRMLQAIAAKNAPEVRCPCKSGQRQHYRCRRPRARPRRQSAQVHPRALLPAPRLAFAERCLGFQHVWQARHAESRPRRPGLRDMDTEQIDISVLFPTGGFGVTQLPEKDYAAAFCRGYNDWIASVCAESPRLKGVGARAVSRCRCRCQGNPARHRRTRTGRRHRRHLRHERTPRPTDVLADLRANWKSSTSPLLVHNSRQGPAGEIRFDTFFFAIPLDGRLKLC